MLAVQYHKISYILYSIQELKEYGSKNLKSVLPSSSSTNPKQGKKDKANLSRTKIQQSNIDLTIK